MTVVKEPLPQNWLIVDDRIEDAELIASAIAEGSQVVDIAHDLEAAEQQLRRKIYDIVILDYYFKGTDKTGVDLMPIIRKLFPGLPLIMISSSDESEIVRAAIRAGADAFVKKYPNIKLLRTHLLLAAVQAQEFRNRQLQKSQYANILLTSEIRADIAGTVRNRGEKVLISGERGTGRTSIAHIFAANFIRSYYKDSPRSIIHVDCRDSKGTEGELFGTEEALGLGAIERALGGVLILDNVDSLPADLKERLRHVFLEGTFVGRSGAEVNVRKIKVISTCGKDIAKVDAAFFAAITDLEIELEPVQKMAEHVEKLIERLSIRKIAFTQKAVEYLASVMRFIDWKMGYVSLAQFINSAICHALETGKTKVYQADFPALEPYDKGLRLDPEKQMFPGKDGELLLYAIRSGRNLPAAQKLLKSVMMNYANDLFEGNASAAAEALGISRSSWNECR